MDRIEVKRQNSLEAVRELIALLERCNAFNWAGKFHNVKDALEAYDLDKAITSYKRIPMPNMGGFLDLILCKENGHNVRDRDVDNELLITIGSALSQAMYNLDVYINKKVDKNEVIVPNGN